MTEILVTDFVIVLLIFLRIFSMLMTAPVFGQASIPALVKISLSIIISYITFLTMDKTAVVVDLNLLSLAMNALREIITGSAMGFMLNFVFQGVSYAGTLIGFDIGLMFSEVLNPFEDNSTNVLGEFIYFAAILVFIFINGHHYIITGVVASFHAIPLGKYTITESSTQVLIKYGFTVFTVAVKIASPVIVSFFLIHLAESIISKVIPNIQVFFVSQPLKIGFGIFLMGVLMPMYVYVLKGLLQSYEDKLYELIKVMGS